VSFRLCACHVGWQNFYELRAAEAGSSISYCQLSKTVGTSPTADDPRGKVSRRVAGALCPLVVVNSAALFVAVAVVPFCCLISSCQGFLAKFNKNFMSLKRMFMEIFHLNLRKVINVNRIPEKVRQQNSKPEDREGYGGLRRGEGGRATSCTQSCRSESQQCG